MKKAPFYKVFYIYQVVPQFRLVDIVFSKQMAEALSNFIEHKTGHQGRVVCFTRDELLVTANSPAP